MRVPAPAPEKTDLRPLSDATLTEAPRIATRYLHLSQIGPIIGLRERFGGSGGLRATHRPRYAPDATVVCDVRLTGVKR
ncbi:MAG: hypothetical protein RIS85_259 [Pseudomonadota bacterium]